MKRTIRISRVALRNYRCGVYIAHADGNWADKGNDLAEHQMFADGDDYVTTVDFRSGDEYKIVIFGIADEESAMKIHGARFDANVHRGDPIRFNWDLKHTDGPHGETGEGSYWLLDPDPSITVINLDKWNANCIAP